MRHIVAPCASIQSHSVKGDYIRTRGSETRCSVTHANCCWLIVLGFLKTNHCQGGGWEHEDERAVDKRKRRGLW